MGQRTAKASFLMVTNLPIDVIFRTAYISENIEIVSPKKSMLKTASSSPVRIDECGGSAVYMTNCLCSKLSQSKNEFKKYPRTAVCQRAIQPMSDVYLVVRNSARSVRLATSHEKVVKSQHAFVVSV